MSAQTQFLYISHNRLTMEMAEQLIGVTMQEKGVSRIVAVDIQQALSMAKPAWCRSDADKRKGRLKIFSDGLWWHNDKLKHLQYQIYSEIKEKRIQE